MKKERETSREKKERKVCAREGEGIKQRERENSREGSA